MAHPHKSPTRCGNARLTDDPLYLNATFLDERLPIDLLLTARWDLLEVVATGAILTKGSSKEMNGAVVWEPL